MQDLTSSDVELELDSLEEDFEWTREKARELYRAGFGDPNMMERWDRIREVIPIEDVIAELQGTRGLVISCPFHGTDSRPSFNIYKRHNDAFCFGCPEGEKYYDSVRFVAAKFGMTRLQAIVWLEKEYELPPLEAAEEEEEDDDTEVVVTTLNFNHLAEPFIHRAASAFLAELDAELVREYIAMFFDALPDRNEDLNSDESQVKVMPMVRTLGWKAVEEIKKKGLR